MKIGILTFHSQLNYGGVLQCWALKRAIEMLGHEVIIIDKWISSTNHLLWRDLSGISLRRALSLLLHIIAGCGHLGKIIRIIRTVRFVRALGLSCYHFCDFRDAPVDLGVDLLVVGSDQVWNPNWNHTREYLLENVETTHISYAASFGVQELPESVIGYYKRALQRFHVISCREHEGVKICGRMDLDATHVVDPTLLLEKEVWQDLMPHKVQSEKRKLVCYFLSVDALQSLPLLEKFAREMNSDVELITNDGCYWTFPKSISALIRNYHAAKGVRIFNSAGPRQFVRSFSNATWTLTDSFHAVMFSSVFNCNLRFLRPSDENRKAMFSRIEEFGSRMIRGNWLSTSIAYALESFRRGEVIEYDEAEIYKRRKASLRWLAGAIEKSSDSIRGEDVV